MGACFTAVPSSIDFPMPVADTHFSTSTSLTSPTPTLRRLPSKRKKGKAKAKAKANLKRREAIDMKFQILIEKLNPLPFKPSKSLDFSKQEKLLKRLGLWDFVQIEFDLHIRVDLIAQLVASYDPKAGCSYVNEHRILVSRADIARAFKLPVRKKKKRGDWSVVVDGMELEQGKGLLEEDSIGFIEDFVSNWVLLHEDTWMMPVDILNWMKKIKDGHPEKVDWAGLLWFMVEEELMKGKQLEDCYYGSHLQHLVRSQNKDVLLKGEPGKVELDTVKREEEVGGNEDDANVDGANKFNKESALSEGPSIELASVQEGREKELEVTIGKGGVRDSKAVDVAEGNEVENGEEQEQWVFNDKNKIGLPLLQPSVEDRRALDNYDGVKEENEVIEAGDGYGVLNNGTVDGEALTGNFLQAVETTEIAYNSAVIHQNLSSVKLPASVSNMQHSNLVGRSLYDNGCKNDIEHNPSLSDEFLNGCAKGLRIGGPSDSRPSYFGACLDQIHQLITRARMMYWAKEEAEEQSDINQQMLLDELHRRESVIKHLEKTKYEEIQKRENEIARLERELWLFVNTVDGYKKALKETGKAFLEYRQRFQVREEPIYKDAGPGGLMRRTPEIKRQHMKQEKEEKSIRLMLEQKAKEAEEEYTIQFAELHDKVHLLDQRLEDLEKEMERLKDLYSSRKGSEDEHQLPENH